MFIAVIWLRSKNTWSVALTCDKLM